jgi:hypothetical protein
MCEPDEPRAHYEARSLGSPDMLLFTFEAPANTTGGPETGLDSFLGRYDCGALQMHYDYGGWSDPLDGAAARPGAIDEMITIDEVPARVVRVEVADDPDGLTYHAAVHFEGRLSFEVRGPSTDAQTIGLAIFDSIDFP